MGDSYPFRDSPVSREKGGIRVWNAKREREGARSIEPKFPVRIFENFFVKWNGNFHLVSFHARAGQIFR